MNLPARRARPRRREHPIRPAWQQPPTDTAPDAAPLRGLPDYRAVVDEITRRAGGRCELRWADCWGTGTDPHHIWPVSEGGPVIVPVVWMLWVCRSCHGFVHSAAGRSVAAEAGHITPANTDYAIALRYTDQRRNPQT